MSTWSSHWKMSSLFSKDFLSKKETITEKSAIIIRLISSKKSSLLTWIVSIVVVWFALYCSVEILIDCAFGVAIARLLWSARRNNVDELNNSVSMTIIINITLFLSMTNSLKNANFINSIVSEKPKIIKYVKTVTLTYFFCTIFILVLKKSCQM